MTSVNSASRIDARRFLIDGQCYFDQSRECLSQVRVCDFIPSLASLV